MKNVVYLPLAEEIVFARWKSLGDGQYKRTGKLTVVTQESLSAVASFLMDKRAKGYGVPAYHFEGKGTLLFLTPEEMERLGIRIPSIL